MKKLLILIIFSVYIFNPLLVMAENGSSVDPIPNAKAGMLIEASTGKVLYKKNINERVAVASMTKMVAQILILENIESGKIKWDDVVTVSKNAADMGGSQIYISEGEKITIRELMKGISMASGNDATVQMAEVISGTEEKFVELMNKKVKELGLKDTQFKNCTGLDQEGHYSTAHDMIMIARDLVVNHPGILEFSSLYEDYLRENTENKFWLVNTNKLIRFYEGADGLKTGFTDAAGYCLAATAKKNGLRLIGVVLGEAQGKVRNSEAMNLLDYGYNNIRMNILKKKDTVIQEINLEKATSEKVEVVLKDDLGIVESLDNKSHKYTYQVDIEDLKLPINVGDSVGKLLVKENNKVVAEGVLTVNKKVDSLSYIKLFLNSLNSLFSGNI